jgi:hypothetical protein
VLCELLRNTKIARATHNMYAYRIDGGNVLQVGVFMFYLFVIILERLF